MKLLIFLLPILATATPHRLDNAISDPPLILTPLIQSGQIEEARRQAEVNIAAFGNVASYSGYLTVDEAYGSNLFFWFFPAESNFETAPVLLWLQGGPGSSSLYGLFEENGPIIVNADNSISFRELSWTKNHSVIYIDNPVGTGYSFTDNGFAQNQTKVGADLYEALRQFFTMFPQLQKNDFFVSGESYAGKYVPAISYTIHKNNPEAELKINLQGLIIGNGLCDPRNQMEYGAYLYQIGLIDRNGRKQFEDAETAIRDAIDNKEFELAFNLFDSLLNSDLTPYPSLFKNLTGFNNYFNYLHTNDNPDKIRSLKSYSSYIQSSAVRAAIHVGDLPYNGGEEVEMNLKRDVMDTIAPWLAELIDNYRVLIFNGQLDIIVAYPLTINYLNQLEFAAADEYKTAERKIWMQDGDVAGYIKKAGGLTEMLIRNAGHMVPHDQGKWGLELISSFVRNKL